MRNIIPILIIYAILLAISCSKESVTEVEQIAGLYKAIDWRTTELC